MVCWLSVMTAPGLVNKSIFFLICLDDEAVFSSQESRFPYFRFPSWGHCVSPQPLQACVKQEGNGVLACRRPSLMLPSLFSRVVEGRPCCAVNVRRRRLTGPQRCCWPSCEWQPEKQVRVCVCVLSGISVFQHHIIGVKD